MLNVRGTAEFSATDISAFYVKVCGNIIRAISTIVCSVSLPPPDRLLPSNWDLRFFPSKCIVVSYASEHSYIDISYNEASLSKIKQRSRRILAVALFVRMCKQWNYPFPARIYPDDIQPVADLPASKYSRFSTDMCGSACTKSTNSGTIFILVWLAHMKIQS